MKYEEALEYLLDIPTYAKKTSKENIRMLLEALGNPCRERKTAHIAGTNGKGSVCAYLNGILLERGYRVGMFTSPHLVDIRERIRINGKCLDQDFFCHVLDEVREAIRACRKNGGLPPSFFETLFLMAAKAFEEKKVDYCIYEAGMGGRNDATNVIVPDVCVITTISLDHTEFLGDTVSAIAREKAGIIKEGVPVVSLNKNPAAASVIREEAEKKHAPCILLTPDDYLDFAAPAPFQRENASLAWKAAETLGVEGSLECLERTVWSCRMEQILPQIYVDGAHNMEAIETLVHTFATCHGGKNKVLLFSAAKDKNYRDMIACLCRLDRLQQVIVAPMKNTRGLDAPAMERCFRACGQDKVAVMEDIAGAFSYAKKLAGPDTVLLCTGSLYLAGEIKAIAGGQDDQL